ncbi:MAG: hypothetical protein Q8O25_08320 [Sulfurisoma sp.]|nr:hypothetical protein [Sulfurisoma sp.]
MLTLLYASSKTMTPCLREACAIANLGYSKARADICAGRPPFSQMFRRGSRWFVPLASVVQRLEAEAATGLAIESVALAATPADPAQEQPASLKRGPGRPRKVAVAGVKS